MKRALTALSLLLAVILVPCTSFAATAATPAVSSLPEPSASNSSPTSEPQPGKDFMAWLKEQPGEKRQEQATGCLQCSRQNLACCSGDLNTWYCGGPLPDGGC